MPLPKDGTVRRRDDAGEDGVSGVSLAEWEKEDVFWEAVKSTGFNVGLHTTNGIAGRWNRALVKAWWGVCASSFPSSLLFAFKLSKQMSARWIVVSVHVDFCALGVGENA